MDRLFSKTKKLFNFAKPVSWFSKKEKLRVIFMGTPEVAVPFLKKLIDTENVVAVFSAPDLPAGRHMQIKESPVKLEANKRSIRVLQQNCLDNEKIVKAIESFRPDLIVAVAYGYKIPDSVINIPTFKGINIHFSLLPKYRGAAPVNWAIVNGEKETGVTSFYLSNKMDAGDIIHLKKLEIKNDDNSETLLKRLVNIGVNVLEETLEILKTKKDIGIKQMHVESTKAPKLKKSDGKIDWRLSSEEIFNRIRGFHPWPGSYSYIHTADSLCMIKLFDVKIQHIEEEGNMPGEILRISKERGLLIKCGTGAIWVKMAQLEGHKKVTGYELYLGRKIQKGDIFES